MTNPISVQLYTLRDEIAEDYVGTLRAVAELGYRAVELVTLGDMSAAALRQELDTLGLQASGMHVGIPRLEQELEAALDEVVVTGAHYVICPWLPPELRVGADGYRKVAALLTQAGEACQARGLQLCYHHHDFEFADVDDTTGLALLADNTDAALVKFELDVYWAAYAGLDPVALLTSLAGRVPLVHLKDMTNDEARTFAEVGSGTLDFPAILAACDDAGVDWLVVEQDRCARPPLESIGMSLAYLQSVGRS